MGCILKSRNGLPVRKSTDSIIIDSVFARVMFRNRQANLVFTLRPLPGPARLRGGRELLLLFSIGQSPSFLGLFRWPSSVVGGAFESLEFEEPDPPEDEAVPAHSLKPTSHCLSKMIQNSSITRSTSACLAGSSISNRECRVEFGLSVVLPQSSR
jgi:hypothetical protein